VPQFDGGASIFDRFLFLPAAAEVGQLIPRISVLLTIRYLSRNSVRYARN